MPGRSEAHAIAWMALIMGIILCGVSIVLGLNGKAFLGRPLGGDFIEFYTIGNILNHYTPERVYDLALATSLQHAALPSMAQTQMLVFGQAPFIASLFRPFALLPYAWAYVVWLGFSATFYIAGLALLFRTLRLNPANLRTGFLLALSSTPFLFETWIGGQVSVVVFFIWALFFWCLENDRRVLAGFVLALCLFKPTLVALPALMLVAGRRWRIVAGFVAGALATAWLSIATVGLGGCLAWFRALSMNGSIVARISDPAHEAKYVDVLAFLHLLLPNQPALVTLVAGLVALVTVGWLALKWWSSDGFNRQLWAATLCCTLVVNPYAPIYDAILLVAALALVVADFQQQHELRLSDNALPGWLLALYLVPWVTQSFAEFLHVQLITLAVAGFAIWLMEAHGNPRARHSKTEQEESTMTVALNLRATGRFHVRSRGLP
jgi:hypothetical protein